MQGAGLVNSSGEGSVSGAQIPAETMQLGVLQQQYQDLEPQLPLEVQQCKQVAKLLINRGHPQDALQLIQHLQESEPGDPDVYFLRGRYLQELGNLPLALSSYHAALQVNQEHFESLVALADIYRGKQELQQAEKFLRKAQEVNPQEQDASKMLALTMSDIAIQLKQQGCGDVEVLDKYQEAICIFPIAQAYYNMGVQHQEQQRTDLALEMYQNALKLNPNDPMSLSNCAGILKEKGDLEGALQLFQKALRSAPNEPIIKQNLALALSDKAMIVKSEKDGGMQQAIQLFTEALILQPQRASILYNLACAYSCEGNYTQACALFEVCKGIDPQNPETYNSLGVIYRDWGLYEKAQECFHTAVSLRPTYCEAMCNLAVLYSSRGNIDAAIQLTNACIVSNPTYAEAHNNLGVLLRDSGKIQEAIKKYEDCVKFQPKAFSVDSNRLYALNYIHEGDDPIICNAHMEWGKQVEAEFGSTLPPLTPQLTKHRYPKRPLRVGYLSPDFYNHSVSYFAEAPLFNHKISKKLKRTNNDNDISELIKKKKEKLEDTSMDENQDTINQIKSDESCQKSQVNVDEHINALQCDGDEGGFGGGIDLYVYSTTCRPDDKTQRFKENVQSRGGVWLDVKNMNDEELGKKIREDEIDVLVELSGHTAYNRLSMMAMRPAPVQVTWIGYPNTTGLKAVDYRITDAICDPVDTKQKFSEELVRMSKCFLCYTPIKNPPTVNKLPALENGYVTFGSFNALCKVTDTVIDVWCKLLQSVPGSRLLIKNKPFGCPVITAAWRQRFLQRGIQSWRVDLLPALPQTVDHLSVYNYIDMSLDPFPYAGTTTTCESLYLGVPCITMTGGGHAHNVSASLMKAIGIADDWVATNHQEYVDVGVKWASRLEELNELRGNLCKMMKSSALCDASEFVRELESKYHKMMNTYIKNNQK